MVQMEIEERLFDCFLRMIRSVTGRQSAAASRGELFLLSYVYRRGVVLPGELSDRMAVSTARVARLLSTLEERGLILRSADPEDHRRVDVSLTAAGEAYVEEFQNRIYRRIAVIVDELGEEDTETYLRITERLLSISEHLSGEDR